MSLPYCYLHCDFTLFYDLENKNNGSDCGVFTCKFADFVSRQTPFVFAQGDIPYFRKRLAYEILTKQLLTG